MFSVLQRPRSIGALTLRSADPLMHPPSIRHTSPTCTARICAASLEVSSLPAASPPPVLFAALGLREIDISAQARPPGEIASLCACAVPVDLSPDRHLPHGDRLRTPSPTPSTEGARSGRAACLRCLRVPACGRQQHHGDSDHGGGARRGFHHRGPCRMTLPKRFRQRRSSGRVHVTPGTALVEDLARLDGDILVLGVGGKMGPDPGKNGQAGRAVEADGCRGAVFDGRHQGGTRAARD